MSGIHGGGITAAIALVDWDEAAVRSEFPFCVEALTHPNRTPAQREAIIGILRVGMLGLHLTRLKQHGGTFRGSRDLSVARNDLRRFVRSAVVAAIRS